jgi:hypothetical protein
MLDTVHSDRRITEVGISYGTCQGILSQSIEIRTVSAKWFRSGNAISLDTPT